MVLSLINRCVDYHHANSHTTNNNHRSHLQQTTITDLYNHNGHKCVNIHILRRLTCIVNSSKAF